MTYRQFAILQKYINGVATGERMKGRQLASGLVSCSTTSTDAKGSDEGGG